MSAGTSALLAAAVTLAALHAARRRDVPPPLLVGGAFAGVLVAGGPVAAGGGDAGGYALAVAVEAALSVDTVVALAALFAYFAVPPDGRARLIGWALAGCAALRLAAVPAGAAAVDRLDWIAYPLAALLLTTTLVLIRGGPEPVREHPPGQNRTLARVSRWVPLTAGYHGALLRVATPAGWHWTPLAVVAATTAMLGAVLAADGLAAGHAATDDHALVAAATTLFAVALLRELYDLADRHLHRVLNLKAALSVLLLFAAVRLLATGPDDPQLAPSLATVAVAVLVGAIAHPRRHPPKNASPAATTIGSRT